MPTTVFPWHSLKARITLSTLVIFLSSLWALSFYASQMLQEDMARLLGEQQAATSAYAASELQGKLDDRIKSLEMIAQAIDTSLIENPAALQKFLDQRFVLHTQFNDGVLAYRADGTAIAASPNLPELIGVNYLDRDYLVGAIKNGKSTIGQPVIGRIIKAPIFHLAVPIRDKQGKVVGALSGVTNLAKPNFLDKITDSRYGKTGGVFVVAPQYRMIVTATDKTRVMEIHPPPGVNSLLDRRTQGYEGSEIFVNPKGAEVLSSAKGVPVAGWYVSAALPVAEAFAPIYEMKQRMLLATLLLTLLSGWLGWWLLKRQLSPLFEVSNTLNDMSGSDQPMQALPVTRQDEIGRLIGSFNRVLATLSQRETALQEMQATLQTAMDQSPAGIVILDAKTSSMRYINDAGLRIRGDDRTSNPSGLCLAEFHAKRPLLDLDGRPLEPDEIPINRAAKFGDVCGREFVISRPDGTSRIVESHAAPIRNAEGEVLAGMAIFLDITERKQTEDALKTSEERYRVAFQTNQDVININRLSDGLLIEANQSFFDIHGFERDEIVGRTTQELNIWVEPAERQRFVEVLQRDSKCVNFEARFKRKNGELIWGLVSASVIELDGVPCVFSIRRDITERKRSEEIINHLAYFDQLTDLPNRTLLQDRLKQAMASSQRSGRYGALLLLDLDYFKTLNDTLGHDMGDLLLKQVAQRLTDCVREEDTVTRQGGDEFVVMLVSLSESQIEAASLVELIGEKISAAFSLPFKLKEIAYRISPSIGASLFLGQQTDIDMLLKQADLAMYKAKDAGRNTLRFFDPDMARDVLKRASLDNDLRDALQKEQFVLHYQAQMTGNQVTGAEVLLRWQHPERGLVFPGEFIPVIEETGHILPVGQWVLETACQQLAAWAIQPEMSHLTIAVNISAHQLNHEEFVDQVLRALERSGANPQRLKLELTESLLVNHVEEIIGKMTVMKAKGVGFSLDDFGTGYSSLAYLKRLPLDQLKIDQSFVRDILTDPNDAAIARMIVVLAETLGLAVIAEGVETEAQRDSLMQQGCHGYQGYLFSRPVPLDEFESYIKRG